MKSLPIVSIVGRPNVGKSSLFNRILGRRIAVVDETAGVTRDRNYMRALWNDTEFVLADTGGMVPNARERMAEEIHAQVAVAIAESQVIVFLTEAATGPTDLDMMIARTLRQRFRDRVILAVNKAESAGAELDAAAHHRLGCGEPLPVSALHGKGVADLMDRICEEIERLGPDESAAGGEAALRLAVVGRPNVGKSSFVNKLLKQQRMIVDNAPGTTRDAIDSLMHHDSRPVRLIDTAGLRRKSQIRDNVEYYANLRALGSLDRCDVAALMIDTTDGMREQDLRILSHALELRRGVIVCWNKWDIVEKSAKTFDNLVKETRERYMELRFIPMISISALTGQRVSHVLDIAFEVHERMGKRLAPAELRSAFFEWVRQHPHPIAGTREVRFLGIKQADASTPLFQIFCTNPSLIQPSYRRYLTNKLQERFDFTGCPVAFAFRTAGKPQRRKQSRSEPEIDPQ
jgi:GTP-binding protein